MGKIIPLSRGEGVGERVVYVLEKTMLKT